MYVRKLFQQWERERSEKIAATEREESRYQTNLKQKEERAKDTQIMEVYKPLIIEALGNKNVQRAS